jgi:hemerythrin
MMMMDFTKGYFAREEQFMAKYKYPEYEDQKRAHTEFLKTNLSFRRMIADEPENFNEDMLLYMKEWAIAHIQDHDIRFAPYLRLQLYLDEHMTTGRRR